MKKKNASRPWYEILLAARIASQDGSRSFTAEELSSAAGISPTDRSPADLIAAAWLGKFVKWGYVRRVGSLAQSKRRCKTLYTVTEWGMKYDPDWAKKGEPGKKRL